MQIEMHHYTAKEVTIGFSLFLMALSAQSAVLYVSPAGNDGNPGSEDRPLRTLERARDRVRLMNRNMTADITVYLEEGTYRLARPLMLDARDSGFRGHSVTYMALNGKRVVISGGVAVTGWEQVDARRNLWSARVPAALRNTRQLYVNGVRAHRTRGRLPVSVIETATGYTASSAAMATWRNASDIEFVYTGGNSLWSERSEGLGAWTEPRCPVASIEGTTITMAQPCWDNSTKRAMLPNGSRTANLVGPASVGKMPEYVENAYELLGTPGDWYFDRGARVIYYVPRPGEDLSRADVEAPVLETLIEGAGTKNAPIHNIDFSGLQFSYATWLAPSSNEGFSEIQANYRITGRKGYATQGLCTLVPGGTCPYGAWTKPPANVQFRYDRQIRFLNDDFAHLGAAALDLGDGSQGDTVKGCVFADISGNGVEIGGVDLPLAAGADATADNLVVNNHIYDIGAEYHGGIGIVAGYAQRTRIVHNQLDHLPYAAISIGWGGWPDKIGRAGEPNTSRNNVIAENRIHDLMLLLADGGAIYTQGLTGSSMANGERVEGNVIYNQYGTGHAIYSDNGSSMMTIRSNAMFHTNYDNWGSRHRSYYDDDRGKVNDPLLVENNYWEQGDPDSSSENVTERGNHLIGALDEVPAAILDMAGLQADYVKLLHKQLGAASAPEPPRRVAAFAGNGFAYVAWNPPVFEGGAPVRSYTVTSSRGDAMALISAADFASYGYVKLSALVNGQAYTFTVTATNANGTSAPSLPSRAVTPGDTPVSVPPPPAHVRALASADRISIHFQHPQGDGNAIVAYAFTVKPGGRKVTLTGRKVLTLAGRHRTFGVIEGLEPGTYRIDVAAVNAAGEGPAATTNEVTISRPQPATR